MLSKYFMFYFRADLSSEQKEALLGLLRKQPHEKITPVIRKHLQGAECRDIEMEEPPPQFAENMFFD